MKTKQQCLAGFTHIEMLIVVAVLALLLAVFLPAWTGHSHNTTHGQIRCQNNLKQVGLSLRQWALDNDGKFPTQISATNGGAMEHVRSGAVWAVFQVMSNELNTPKILACPHDPDTNRIVATTFSAPGPQTPAYICFTDNRNVSYFVGLDTKDSQSKNLLLIGDCNFEVGGKPIASGLQALNSKQTIGWTTTGHPKRTGNLGFADGSVRPNTSRKLPAVFKATGLATNRLVIP